MFLLFCCLIYANIFIYQKEEYNTNEYTRSFKLNSDYIMKINDMHRIYYHITKFRSICTYDIMHTFINIDSIIIPVQAKKKCEAITNATNSVYDIK